MNNCIYKSFIQAKNERIIPVLQNDRTIESRYNPEREASTLVQSIDSTYSFFLVLGIASGSVIEELVNRFPNSKIIGVETCDEDILFLSQLENIKRLTSNENIIFTSLDNLEEVLINNYVPSLYGNYKIINQKAWIQYNESLIPILNKKVSHAIGIISADYSVQCHFGKIWQSNIINNLKILSQIKSINYPIIDSKKTAYVIAAGPSLEQTINKIDKNSFVISTDTAYHTLIKNNINVDVVISIDGQHISHNHFIEHSISQNTICALDLCSDYSISKYLYNKGCNILFFKTGHPLSNFANKYCNKNIIDLFSGAGTVTITALDLAIKLGFKNIHILGGDFAYINGKSYVKGTYFDTLFGKESNKLCTIENQYDKLMYRTDLLENGNNRFSTQILDAYKSSLIKYLYNNKCSYVQDNDEYIIKVNNNNIQNYFPEALTFDYRAFISDIKNNSQKQLLLPLLPYIAWLRNKSHTQENIDTLLKLAQSNIVLYN